MNASARNTYLRLLLYGDKQFIIRERIMFVALYLVAIFSHSLRHAEQTASLLGDVAHRCGFGI